MTNRETNKLIMEYLEDCKDRLSPLTVNHHRGCLKAYSRFLGNKCILELKEIDVRHFLNEMKLKGRARSTIAGSLAKIRAFFKYIETYHNKSMPSLTNIKIEDYPRSTWEGLGQDPITRGEVRKLIETADNPRDTLIIAMLYYLGLRVKELAFLRIENVDTINRVAEVIGKGNKPRKVPYSIHLDRAIHLWLSKERKGYVNYYSPYFFPSKHGKHLRPHSIANIVYNVAEKAGIQKVVGKRSDGSKMYKIHPHILRHSYATHAVDDEIPLYIIQRMMGHTRLDTTLRYAGELSPFKSYYDKFKGV